MIPQTFTATSNISAFAFKFFCFTFLVVVSVRYVKPIHVGFRAHVKIASRIVSYCSRSPFLGSGMNVENVHSYRHSPVSQIATHILCILSRTVSPPALNSSAGASSGPVALRLAVRKDFQYKNDLKGHS